MAKTIGLLGGTFDPVHTGHLRLALEIHQMLGLSEIRIIPLNIPPHRSIPVASNEHRLNMLFLATKNVDSLTIDEREIDQNKISWTIDTVMSLRTDYPNHSLCLIIGDDAFLSLDSWRCWQELIEYVHIIIVSRHVNDIIKYTGPIKTFLKERETSEQNKINNELHGYVHRITVPMLDISSTRIRQLLADRKSADFLLPESVLNYINTRQLYG